MDSSRSALYAKLPAEARKIRLLKLLSADDPSDEIECILDEHLLDSKPSYKALSYAWKEGDRLIQDDNDDLLRREGRINLVAFLGTKTVAHIVTVSWSLSLALRRLRQTHGSVVLWIDSLCINQDDNDERTEQVAMMGTIYQSASEVIIWLGEKEIEDEMGEWLQGIYQRTVVYHDWNDDVKSQSLVDRYIDSYEMLRTSHSGPVTQRRDIYGAFCLIWLLSQGRKSTDIPFYHATSFTNRFRMEWATQVSEGLRAIMRRNWWRRAWVVQETVLATKATIVYSTLSAPWLVFARAAVNYLQEQLGEDVDQRQVFQGLASVAGRRVMRASDALGDFCRTVLAIENTRSDWASKSPLQLLPLLRRFRSREATDNRDKIFSLLGLVNSWLTTPPRVNYKMTELEVYIETTAHIIEDTQSLSVLSGTVSLPHLRTKEDLLKLSKSMEKLQKSSYDDLNRPIQLSWVVDWSISPTDGGLELERIDRLECYSAGSKNGYACLHGNTVLETKGYIIGKIARVADAVPEDAIERLRQTIFGWKHWWLQNTGHEAPGYNDLYNAVFPSTVCGQLLYTPRSERGSLARQSSYARASMKEIAEAYAAWASDTTTQRNRKTAMFADLITNSYEEPEMLTQLKNSFYYSVRSATVSRKFFAFNRDLGKNAVSSLPHPLNIGIGPSHLEVGDLIYLPHGSQVPLIIRNNDASTLEVVIGSALQARPAGEPKILHEKWRLIGASSGSERAEKCFGRHSLHQLIGDAIVYGVMNGEESPNRLNPRKVDTVYFG